MIDDDKREREREESYDDKVRRGSVSEKAKDIAQHAINKVQRIDSVK